MIETKDDAAADPKETLAALARLIEAIDRRVPQLERLGEAQIAHDAAELREQAVRLIRRLEGATDAAGGARRER